MLYSDALGSYRNNLLGIAGRKQYEGAILYCLKQNSYNVSIAETFYSTHLTLPTHCCHIPHFKRLSLYTMPYNTHIETLPLSNSNKSS